MSTLNSGDNDLAYDKESKCLSERDSLNLWELVGVKSQLQIETELKAKKEKVDHLIAHTEKVRDSWGISSNIYCTFACKVWVQKYYHDC